MSQDEIFKPDLYAMVILEIVNAEDINTNIVRSLRRRFRLPLIKDRQALESEVVLIQKLHKVLINFLSTIHDKGEIDIEVLNYFARKYFAKIEGLMFLRSTDPMEPLIFWKLRADTLFDAISQNVVMSAIEGDIVHLRNIRRCEWCEHWFLPSYSTTRFCSDSHRASWHQYKKKKELKNA